jgi:DNA-binding transcriptional MerR regulator
MSIEGSETSARSVAGIDAAANPTAKPVEPPALTISDLAVECGVTLRTLRFYEAKGLLKPRRDGATRLYSEEDRARLKLILKGKQLGFTLREIIALVAKGSDIGALNELGLTREQCIEQLRLLERQKCEIEEAIAELRQTYSSLCQREAPQCARAAVADHSSAAD